MMNPEQHSQVGIVVIGRNEGPRLERCLLSLHTTASHIVYVDSGSTDGSVALARSLGVDVVELDMNHPFTMARGRNAGAWRLLRTASDLAFLQFIDGDCELDPAWVSRAVEILTREADIAVVCGRRRERDRDASIYNRLIDMEWDTPLGDTSACGGDALMRADLFVQVGGFNELMIAGEEPELCVRLREAGGRVVRIDYEMTLHDAALSRFGQWWKRAVRAGHAYAEGAALHGRGSSRHNVRAVRSALFWGAAVPISLAVTVCAGTWAHPLLLVSGFLVTMVCMQWFRIMKAQCRAGHEPSDARLYAMFCLVSKPAAALGILKYWMNRITGRRSRLIEYKDCSPDIMPG